MKVLEKCQGLNNVDDPNTLGSSELQEAVNVIIDNQDRVTRIDGHAKKISSSTAMHSLFCDGGECLVMDGTTLNIVDPGLTGVSPIRTGMSGERIACRQEGNSIYYSNSYEHGIVADGTHYDWEVDEYRGPDTDRFFEPIVPFFDHIAIHNGWMVGSIDNALFAAVYPGLHGLWDMSNPVMFSSKVIMFESVSDGLYVSDEERMWFLRGAIPSEFVQGDPITNYPAYEWSAAIDSVDGFDMGFDKIAGLCRLWRSPVGVCVGTPGGLLLNVTRDKIVFPGNGTAAASLVRGSHFYSTVR